MEKTLFPIPLMGLLILTIYLPNIFAQDVPELAENALPATVYLEITDKLGEPISYGSGFFVSPTHIVTNFHVVVGATHVKAKLIDIPKKYPIEGLVAIDPKNDLALLQVKIIGIKPLLLGDSDKVRIGEQVYVVGNPKGQEGTFSDGIISRLQKEPERFQMTAPISPGSSGGPVLNSKGKVIGVTFMTIIGGQNLNFAIPSKYVKKMLDEKGIVTTLAESDKYISAETYWSRGNIKVDLGLLESAISDYSAAISLKPDYVEAYTSRAFAKVKLGQYRDAIVDYDTAIRLKPDDAGAYHDRGLTKAGLGQYRDAIVDYDTAIRLKPDDATTYFIRGSAKAGLGQYRDAIVDYDTAIRLKPDFVEAYYHRGLIKAGLGQYRDAITDFDIAIKLKPDYVEAYAGRGAAKYVLGSTLEARQDWQTALQLARQAGDLERANAIQETMREFK